MNYSKCSNCDSLPIKECPNCGFSPLHQRIINYDNTRQVIDKCALCGYNKMVIYPDNPKEVKHGKE